MSYLVDDISKKHIKIPGKGWFIAKPNTAMTLKDRIKDCILILKNKAVAVHFEEENSTRNS